MNEWNAGTQERKIDTQLKQRFSSEILWHFVSRNKSESESYSILLSILKTGLKAAQQTESSVLNMRTRKFPAATKGCTAACLADIPLKDLHIHAERYGKFAIGFFKSKAIANGFNPVLYVNPVSPVFIRFQKLRDELRKRLKKSGKDEWLQKLDDLLDTLGALSKSGDLLRAPKTNPRLDQTQKNNFYYEREWRSTGDWDFGPEDVAMIILPETKLDQFDRDREISQLRILRTTTILPFHMIYLV